MRIDRTTGASPLQRSGAVGKGKKKSATGKSGDSIKVSDGASLREKAAVMLSDMSAVRMERIEEIRDALEKGNFQSDSRKVAAQIISNALAEHPWS